VLEKALNPEVLELSWWARLQANSPALSAIDDAWRA